MVDVFRRDDLMSREDGGWHWLSGQDVERETYQPRPVAFRKICNRCDQRCVRRPEFLPRIGLRVLPYDRTRRVTSGFAKGTDRAECARIVRGTHEHAARLRKAEIAADSFERCLELAVAVERDDAQIVAVMKRLFDSGDDAFAACADERTRTRKLEDQHFVDVPGPARLCVLTEMAAGKQA